MSTLLRPRDVAQATKPKARRGTYFVQTWGCQMNEEDSEQLGLSLEAIGFEKTLDLSEAQVILLNTCSVRKKPEDKAFSLLGELAIHKIRNPDIVLGVCGCMAQIRAKEIRQRAPHVDFVLGTGDIGEVASLVEDAISDRRFQTRLDLPERRGKVVDIVPQRAASKVGKLKTFVPIQYGCDKFCTYCIVPSTRGRERSRPTEEIVAEARELAALGTREITLLGQTVNSYGKNLAEGNVPFSQLLRTLAEIPELQRIRYTSPYPRDFKADLIETIRDCPKVMEHCHLPLQAGDDEVLANMKRVYTVASFREIVREMRTAVPHLGLTTDIIVGFPGESDAQFERTLGMMTELRFDGAFMFVYSPRPGTPAADLEQVPTDVKKQRIHRLVELQNQITLEKNAEWIGKTVEVLVEGRSPKNPTRWQGYSREFRMVHFSGEGDLAGVSAKVKITASHLWGLSGDIAA